MFSQPERIKSYPYLGEKVVKENEYRSAMVFILPHSAIANDFEEKRWKDGDEAVELRWQAHAKPNMNWGGEHGFPSGFGGILLS